MSVGMPSFGDLEDDAKKVAAGHGNDVDKGVTDAENEVDQRTGGKDDPEVKKAGDYGEKALGADQTAPADQQQS
jgi:hypothetical protein